MRFFVKTVTIKRDVNHWYACFSVQRDTVALPESSKDIGLDVGLDRFVALSNGREIDNPRDLKQGLAHRKIRNHRAAFHHHLSRCLVERYGFIAVEDLNIQGLARGILAGPVHDAGWTLSLPNSRTSLQRRARAGGSAWNQPIVRMRSGRAQDSCRALA